LFPIYIPLFGIQSSDPIKFDPDRFAKENIDSVTPFTILPFGVGNRSCVGGLVISFFLLLQI
jgi:cytochrome P450 family 6